MTWTDEAVDILRIKAAEGLSASRIAIALGRGLSRNAVIGKCARLGVSLSGKPDNRPIWVSRPAPSRPVSRIGQGSRTRSTKRKAHCRVEPAPIADSLWLSLSDLRPSSCRFPRGTPGDADFRYCGAPKAIGSYCLCHHTLTHQAAA